MTDQMWDVVIVGAGPAGCAAAYDLQEQGHRVLLVDRAEFPRAKACAGGLTMKAVRALRYSIAPVVRRWCNGLQLEGGAGQRRHIGRRAAVCAMTVREELDAFCLEKTRKRGVRFERVGTLRNLSNNDSAVLLSFDSGQSAHARFVIGADGVHSAVRTLATDGTWFHRGFAVEANVPYWAGEHERFPLTFDFAPVGKGYGWLFPRNDHVNVGLYVENNERIGRAELESYIEQRCGSGRERSRIVGQHLGLGAACYAPVCGTRVVLAGDAAGFVDPLTGEGISGAIQSGQAAAAAVHAALTSDVELGEVYPGKARALQQDLRVAEFAAERFHGQQERGWRLLRAPLVPGLALRAYSDGLPLAQLLRAVRVLDRVRIFHGAAL